MIDSTPIRFIPALYSSSREDARIDMLVIHYTATATLDECVSIFLDPARRVSCHYIVDTDGDIVQMVYDEDCAWHCGASRWHGRERCNPWSIGIEIVNQGQLVRRAENFFGWPGDFTAPYTGPTPVYARRAWWTPYPPAQMESVFVLSGHLVERYQIPLDKVVRHSDIAPDRKIDPGPVFPWRRFRTVLSRVASGGR